MNYLSSHNSSAYVWPNPTGISTVLLSHVLATVFHPKCNTQLPECPIAFIIVWFFRCKDGAQFLMKNKWQIKNPTSCEILWPTGLAFILAAPRAECTVRLRITSGCWSDIRLRLTRVRLRTHLLWFAQKCQAYKQVPFIILPKIPDSMQGKQNKMVS